MKKILYLFLTVSLIFSSCEEEEEVVVIEGCMDSAASNYNSQATLDNNSCCKSCGNVYTLNDDATDEQVEDFNLIYAGTGLDDSREEFCGDDLSDMEDYYTTLYASINYTMEIDGMTVKYGCNH